ncbi:DUF3597 domain-containing protein [Ramlibacter alkalitolerans]|uniref:DUF3597 domain-containing protein n=1 Tax=Ramlibacter alkalitolerans TaxID=2039631 RepID=A0ABS1JWK1_9BURK|nr:DUF3597 domain-containing protein [Ramlibacter alkalitolerans]MBL0428658.1 DUF3597 domain-containing protein [Ramlibacter alkalitolerans]
MSILGNIFGRIFPGAHAQQPSAPAATPPTSPGTATPSAAQPQATTPAAAANAQPTGAATTAQQVDIEQVLDGMAAKNSQKLNWRNSIVDLMKLVGMDSTLQERRELADELGYSGDKQDTAAMNMWLHKQVMKRMAENGGKVPANLMD